MEKNNTEKEEFKTIQSFRTESNYMKRQNKTQNFQLQNVVVYSKKIKNKHMETITKFFTRDRMLLETPPNLNKYNNMKLLPKNNKKEVTIEKEKLLNQLIITKKEMDKINNEFKEYKDFYNQLQESNLTFKTIIEKILKIKETDYFEDIDENILIISNKKKDKKLNAFKRQILDYEKSIEKQEKILAEAKSEKKTNDFYEINKLLDDKNLELENLVSKNKKLQMSKHKKNEEINYYYNTIKDMSENFIKMEENIKLNEKKLYKVEDELYNLENEKEEIIKKLNSLVEESINVELNNEQKKKEMKSLTKEYEKIKDILKEKEKDDNEINNVLNKIESIKKTIEKNNNKINMLNYYNNELKNDLSIMQTEYTKLNERFKLGKKLNIEKYEKEKKLIKEEILKNKAECDEIKNENKENIFLTIPEKKMNINDNNNLMKEIERLKKELEEKQKEKTDKEKELIDIKNEYNSLQKESKPDN